MKRPLLTKSSEWAGILGVTLAFLTAFGVLNYFTSGSKYKNDQPHEALINEKHKTTDKHPPYQDSVSIAAKYDLLVSDFYTSIAEENIGHSNYYTSYPLWTDQAIFVSPDDFNRILKGRVDNAKQKVSTLEMHTKILNIYSCASYPGYNSLNQRLLDFIRLRVTNQLSNIVLARIIINDEDEKVVIFDQSQDKIIGFFDVEEAPVLNSNI